MNERVGTRVAVRVMGVWVRRADAPLQAGSVRWSLLSAQQHGAHEPVVQAALVAVPHQCRHG